MRRFYIVFSGSNRKKIKINWIAISQINISKKPKAVAADLFP
jgi:hypothetical protein